MSDSQKTCTKCSVSQPLTAFNKNRRYPDGLTYYCKTCIKTNNADRYATAREGRIVYAREYREKNRERMRGRARDRHVQNRGRNVTAMRVYYSENRVRIVEARKAWRKRNRAAITAALRHRRHVDPAYKMYHNYRVRLRSLLRGGRTTLRFRDLVGCSTEDLRLHIEAQFLPGMSWDNHGPVWHIDHVLPLSWADPTSDDDLRRVLHHTNLRPLWARENLRKGARIG